MGITIFAGGCRQTTQDGKSEEKNCNKCAEQGLCELEPRARKLAQIITAPWISTVDRSPAEATAVLYLEYPSEETPLGKIRYGHYEKTRKRYVEQASGSSLFEKYVIAWMPVPAIPNAIYENYAFRQRQVTCFAEPEANADLSLFDLQESN
jgi:hypothetical protein